MSHLQALWRARFFYLFFVKDFIQILAQRFLQCSGQHSGLSLGRSGLKSHQFHCIFYLSFIITHKSIQYYPPFLKVVPSLGFNVKISNQLYNNPLSCTFLFRALSKILNFHFLQSLDLMKLSSIMQQLDKKPGISLKEKMNRLVRNSSRLYQQLWN